MADNVVEFSSGTTPRVELLRDHSDKPLSKKKFGYVVGINMLGRRNSGGDLGTYQVYTEKGQSKMGEIAFLVTAAKHGRGGALWYSADALRFTKSPTDPLSKLSDEQRVALDLLLAGRNGRQLEALIPDQQDRIELKALAAWVKSMTAR